MGDVGYKQWDQAAAGDWRRRTFKVVNNMGEVLTIVVSAAPNGEWFVRARGISAPLVHFEPSNVA